MISGEAGKIKRGREYSHEQDGKKCFNSCMRVTSYSSKGSGLYIASIKSEDKAVRWFTPSRSWEFDLVNYVKESHAAPAH